MRKLKTYWAYELIHGTVTIKSYIIGPDSERCLHFLNFTIHTEFNRTEVNSFLRNQNIQQGS